MDAPHSRVSGVEPPATAAVVHGLVATYSVEKLGSCELEIFPMNQIAAENQP
jgi:hypothetical protein